jgi:hypothetical protein
MPSKREAFNNAWQPVFPRQFTVYFGVFIVWCHNVRDVLCVPLCAADCASAHATRDPGHFKQPSRDSGRTPAGCAEEEFTKNHN